MVTCKALLVILALGVNLSVVACDGGKQRSSTRSAGETSAITQAVADVDIVSSLEGMGVLPRHIRWTATTSLPPERIKNVLFNVDARRMWLDDAPRFSYGEDDAYLAAALFWDSDADKEGGEGHQFAVRVRGTDGSVWEETVRARVPKPKVSSSAPAYGIWSRVAPNAPPNQKYSERSYTAHMVINSFGLWVGRTYERVFVYELSADARRFHIGVPIFYGSQEGYDFSGLHTQGYQCAADGPSATYGWSWTKDRFGPFNEEHLILEAEQEPCAERRRILEGHWEQID